MAPPLRMGQVIKSRLWLSTVIAFVPVLASQKVVDFVSVLTSRLPFQQSAERIHNGFLDGGLRKIAQMTAALEKPHLGRRGMSSRSKRGRPVIGESRFDSR